LVDGSRDLLIPRVLAAIGLTVMVTAL
jgi:hypothetical protein